jgi:penicillin-binding protein 2
MKILNFGLSRPRWLFNGALALQALTVIAVGQDEATTPVITDLPETEEIGVVLPEEELNVEDVPEPPAILTESFIPEPAAVLAHEALPYIPQELSENTSIAASWQTQKDARTLLLRVPAPRGQIVDRNGYCLANNNVGFYYAIQFPRFENPTDEQVLAYARERVDFISKRLPETPWEIKDEDILAHYKNRRWIPLHCSHLVRNEDWATIRQEVMEGVKVQPTYYRSYPHNNLAAHFLGYVSKQTNKLPTGPITTGEPVVMELAGRTGLEKKYEDYLKGKPGQINVIFDGDGNELPGDVRRNPTEGNHLVLTIEREFQMIAESTLRSSTRAGALVIMDVWDGDIITMASHPSYDPNSFVPAISKTEYQKFLDDKRKPLVARAYQGQYPPASTFKVPVALAVLETDKVGPTSKFSCPGVWMLGKRPFLNWHKRNEAPMDVRRALKRSCNPYFYQVSRLTGADPIISLAGRLGYGEKTGIPVDWEAAGRLPTHEWMKKEHGYTVVGTALVSFSIGQGKLLATPLQMARAMCAVANGRYLPKARLVKHIQDLDGNIVEAFPIEQTTSLSVNGKNLEAVHDGMKAVVHESGGTGRRGSIKYCSLAGKTGTGQWSDTRNVALFAGFVPAENPEYAFVAVYEGNPGEGVSGGRQAATMIASVFNQIYAKKKARGDKIGASRAERKNRKATDEEAQNAEATSDAGSSTPETRSSKPRSKPQEVRRAEPAARKPAPKKKKRTFIEWLRGKR